MTGRWLDRRADTTDDVIEPEKNGKGAVEPEACNRRGARRTEVLVRRRSDSDVLGCAKKNGLLNGLSLSRTPLPRDEHAWLRPSEYRHRGPLDERVVHEQGSVPRQQDVAHERLDDFIRIEHRVRRSVDNVVKRRVRFDDPGIGGRARGIILELPERSRSRWNPCILPRTAVPVFNRRIVEFRKSLATAAAPWYIAFTLK